MESCLTSRDCRVRILVAGGGALFRGIVAAVIAQAPDLEVVASIPGSPKIVPVAGELRPDAVLLGDVAPDADLVSVISGVHEELPSCGVLMIGESRRLGDLRQAMAAGAVGYLEADIGPGELIAALRHVGHGASLADDTLALRSINVPKCPLTERELEVLRLAATGAPCAEIAFQLRVSPRTVRNHMSRIVGKVNARNRIDAIRIAADAGWT